MSAQKKFLGLLFVIGMFPSCQTSRAKKMEASNPPSQSVEPVEASSFTRFPQTNSMPSHRLSYQIAAQPQEFIDFYTNLSAARLSPPKVSASRPIGRLSEFPVEYNERVEKWLKQFTAHDGKTLQEWLKRSRPYARMIKEALEEDGLPQTLFYVPLIESGFLYQARSPKAATGPWQFMKGTAQLYKLTMNEWVDERRDPVKSTHAASRLLKNLYDQYQDWYLALAAYNAGPARISRGLRQVKSKSYWSLVNSSAVKAETKDYVPKLLAVMMIAENPKAFGLSWENDGGDSNMPYTYVELDRPLEIAAIERELLLPPGTIKKWNPKLLSNITPPSATKHNPFRLKIHVDHASKLYASLKHIPGFEVDYVQTHRISNGETLSGIARRYGSKPQNILKLNPDLQAHRLKIGRTLLIPVRNPKLAGNPELVR